MKNNESSEYQRDFQQYILYFQQKCFIYFSFPFWKVIQIINGILFPKQYSIPIK